MEGSTTPDWLQDNGEGSGAPSSGLDNSPDEDTLNTNEASSRSRCACCSCGCVFLSLISLSLLGLFVFSAVVQTDDVDRLHWIIFYSLNAVVPAIFFVYYTCCFPAMALHVFSAVTAIWSIVYIVIASLGVKDAADNETLREEYILEIAGASIGLFSSLYHSCMVLFFVKKGDKAVDANEERNEGTNVSEDV